MADVVLDKRAATAAIAVLAGKEFRNPISNKDATLEILESMEEAARQEVAAQAVDMLLDRLDKDKRERLFRDINLLGLSISIAHVAHPGMSAAMRIVRAAAREGFLGYFPNLPIRLLSRSPNTEEVDSLVSAYVSDSASRCTADERKLEALARACMRDDDAERQVARIRKFAHDFESYD